MMLALGNGAPMVSARANPVATNAAAANKKALANPRRALRTESITASTSIVGFAAEHVLFVQVLPHAARDFSGARFARAIAVATAIAITTTTGIAV